MTLTKKDVLLIIGMIQVNYAYAYKDMSKESLALMAEVWFNSLKIYPKDVIFEVLQLTLEKSNRPPTLADIICNLKNLVFSNYPNANILWNEILQAINCATQYFYFGEQYTMDGIRPIVKLQKVFDNMNEVCQEWLCDVHTLKNMRKLDMTALECEKARFNKELPNILESIFLRKRCSTIFLENVIKKQIKEPQQMLENKKHTQ